MGDSSNLFVPEGNDPVPDSGRLSMQIVLLAMFLGLTRMLRAGQVLLFSVLLPNLVSVGRGVAHFPRSLIIRVSRVILA
jgi:hypothetical protein